MKAHIKKKGSKDTPAISTSSLPDIIFMLLFFFMVSTTMREVELKVMNQLPSATEVQKLEKKSLVSYIYVGPPSRQWAAQYGTEPKVQLNNSFSSVNEIGEFIASEREKLSEADRAELTTSLKVDKNTKMGPVTDIKQALRRANALKISYASSKKAEE
ncbi:hypothetical protein BN938_1614 [Mucinivorans hirudinis]|uniref:Biopolymer transport protein ExbD/TolR n=1 Tax=Mucinivorans hirudinis TaxID=1433126 RepID=A0A060R8D2_9BACT|nr:hypothetical protein BN938_1614 [Mucinivorans hirudinis]